MAEEELKTGVQFEGKEEYIKDVFTEIADYYDEMNEIMSMHMVQGWHRFMMRKAGDIRGKRCLDVGTGTGEIAPPGRRPSWDSRSGSTGGRGTR